MPKQELTSLSVAELKRRRKFAFLILGILTGVLLFCAGLAVLEKNATLVAIAAALLAVAIPMIVGLKQIREELDRR